MNERIEALLIEAHKQTEGGIYKGHLSVWTEKFAELIVEECAELFVDRRYMVLNPLQPFADERVRALKEHDKDTVRTIKKHFGVEE